MNEIFAQDQLVPVWSIAWLFSLILEFKRAFLQNDKRFEYNQIMQGKGSVHKLLGKSALSKMIFTRTISFPDLIPGQVFCFQKFIPGQGHKIFFWQAYPSWSKNYAFLYKKLGSGHSTKSFLISHEILSILVLKVA